MLKSYQIRQIHRWMGLVFSLSLLMSSASGILHQVMTRTQSAPPSARPGGREWKPESIAVSIPDALRKAGLEKKKLLAVNVRDIHAEPWYQFFLEGEADPVYVNAADGTVNFLQDEIYASQIASDYLGGIPVKKTDYLTRFNGEYLNIFRLLPVYRFDAGDKKATRVYVSTVTGSVARHTDRHRQFEANIFSNFHKLAFIPDKDLRDFILIAMTIGIFLTGIAGITLFFISRKK